jgi:hypothetical protein
MNTEGTLTAREVAELFFDRTGSWLKWREDQGFLRTELGAAIGGRVGNKRGGRGGDRVFALVDVASIADSLQRTEVLDQDNHDRVLARVEAYASVIEALGEFDSVRSSAAISKCIEPRSALIAQVDAATIPGRPERESAVGLHESAPGDTLRCCGRRHEELTGLPRVRPRSEFTPRNNRCRVCNRDYQRQRLKDPGKRERQYASTRAWRAARKAASATGGGKRPTSPPENQRKGGHEIAAGTST